MDQLSIDFYDKSHASVTIDWGNFITQGDPPEMRQFFDALLFACYTLRQMRNLGKHLSTDILARKLRVWDLDRLLLMNNGNLDCASIVAWETHLLHEADLYIDVPEKYAERYNEPVILVPNQGAGRRSFVARLSFAKPSIDPNLPLIFLHARGFGLGLLIGKDMPLYAPDSVLLLLAHICKIHRSSTSFLDGLTKVASECANAYHTGAIGPLNYEVLALSYVVKHCSQGA